MREKDGELLEYNNDDNSLKDSSVMEQEEPESQLMLTELTDRYISVETIEYDENINTADSSDQIMDEEQNFSEEQNFVGFPEDQIDIEDKCITETVSNKGEIEVILSNIEETLVEETIGSDGTRIENDEQDDLLTRMNCDQDSSVEKETLIFNAYCANSPTGVDVEIRKNKTEEDESKKEEEIREERVKDKNLINSSDSNTDVEAIPKLIIKKADPSHLKSECSIDRRDSSETYNNNKYDTKLLSELRPKIPKVIIMKNRSRSVTPTVEILEKSKYDKSPDQSKSMDVDNKDVESYTLK